MGMELTTTSPGPPAHEALAAAVRRAKTVGPLAPVTVVVATNYVGVSARRRLARPAGLAAVQFLTQYRLAELLGGSVLAAAGRRPVSTPIVGAAVRAVLAEAPGRFAPVAAHPATEAALVQTYRELRELPHDALERLSRASARGAEVVRLHRAVHARLRGAWHDEADLFLAAVDAVRSGVPMLAQLGSVVVHLPERVTPSSALLLRELAEGTAVELVLPWYGDADADAASGAVAARLGLPAPPPPREVEDPPVVDLVVSATDADDEVRAALREVAAALDTGTPLERIALLHGARAPYARIVHEQLEAAGIAHNGAAVRPLTESVTGRVLLGLLDLPGRGWRRVDVFTVLASGPVLDGGGRPAPVSTWERHSRVAGIVGGVEQWDRRLGLRAAEFERAAAERDDKDGEGAGLHQRRQADDVRALRRLVLELVDELGSAAVPRPWSEQAAWARALLHRMLGGERRRARWPAEERAAFDAVEAALDRLGHLGEVESAAVGLDVFARALRLELEAALGRVGRFGSGVLTGHVGMAGGLELDLVVVVGLVEGTFPTRRNDDSLVPDRDRRAVGGGLLPRRDDRRADEHRQLLAALAAPGPAGRRILCFPRGDLRTTAQQVPSRWLLDEVARLAGREVRPADLHGLRHEPWYDEVPSFEAGLLGLRDPSCVAEFELADLLRHRRRGRSLDEHPLAGEPVVAAALDLLGSRRSPQFTRFDGDLSAVVVTHPVWEEAQPVSATRLERWATCPYAYLLFDVLGVEQAEVPEAALDLSALEVGSLVHKALEESVKHQIASGADAVDVAVLLDWAERGFRDAEERGVTGRPRLWARQKDRIRRELRRFAAKDAEWHHRTGSVPIAAEHAFGLPRSGEAGGLVVELADGRSVTFRGSIDRLDRNPDGSLHVVDYKTGGSSRYKLEPDPVVGGTKLQLAVYALAARATFGTPDTPVRSEYWFVSDKGQWKRIGYLLFDDERLERFYGALRTIIDGISAGAFPAVPPKPDTRPRQWAECTACDPDVLGTADAYRLYERKLGAGALTAVTALAYETRETVF